MKERIEYTFGKTAKGVMKAVNPFKKVIIKTHCIVHKYINNRAIEILKRQQHTKEYHFFERYKYYLNEGVTWADQDFRSSNHFYHFDTGKGLYGFSNSLNECRKYYTLAEKYLKMGNIEKAVFYFGAACHMIQDATVPQHANKKLLKQHRNFELWVISKIIDGHNFEENKAIKRYEDLDEYIKQNAILANKVYSENINIKDRDERYLKVTEEILEEAKITTAGIMIDFFNTFTKFNEK